MRWYLHVLFLLGSPVWLCSAGMAEDGLGFRTDFATGAELSTEDLREVVALAQQCGISRVGGVRTSYIVPSTNWSVAVSSTETTNGRTISYATVFMLPGRGLAQRKPPVKGEGKFWVYVPIHTNTLTSFIVKGHEMRVAVDGLSLGEADRIVGLLAAKKVRYSKGDWELAVKARGVDVTHPSALGNGGERGKVYVGYGDGYGGVRIRCLVEESGITVVDFSEGAP